MDVKFEIYFKFKKTEAFRLVLRQKGPFLTHISIDEAIIGTQVEKNNKLINFCI